MALASALRVLRPSLRTHTGAAPSPRLRSRQAPWLQIVLEHTGSSYTLRLTGPDFSVVRVFPEPGDCDSAIRTAALIADGALDEISNPSAAPRIDTLAPPRPLPPLEIRAAASGMLEQGTLGAAFAAGIDLGFRMGLVEWGAAGEFRPTTSLRTTVATGSQATGPWTWRETSGAGEIFAGVAPRVGPGAISVAAAAGLTGTSVSVAAASLFHLQAVSATNGFVALRAGYTLDLPRRFFLAGRLEERFAPWQTAFAVQGGGAQVSTRAWTLAGSLSVGWRFR